MTIQQHASFDSSAAELNATSKLVKAWESKNAKNAAKAGGVSLMALSLAACGGSSSTTTTTTTDATTGTTTTVTPISVALTAGNDAVVGTTGADSISGARVDTVGTWNSGDTIAAGAGTDTLTATLTGNITPADGAITGVENLSVTNLAGVAATITFSTATVTGIAGVTSISNIGSTASNDLVLTRVLDNASITLNNTSGDTTVTFADTALAGTADTLVLNVNGNTGAVNIGDSTGGGDAFETVTINTSGALSTFSAANLDATATTVNVTGSGALDIDGAAAFAKLATFNGASATGDIDVQIAGDTVTGATNTKAISTGSGADLITISALDPATVGAVSVDAGAGNDTVVIGARGATDYTIAGGDGTDILSVGAAAAVALHSGVSGFETLYVTAGQAQDLLQYTGSNTFTTLRADAASVDFSNASAAALTLELTANAATLASVARAADGAADSLTVKTTANNSVTTLTVDDAETLAFNTADGTLAVTNFNAEDATSITVAGDNAVNLGTYAATTANLATFDASGMTGAAGATIVASASTVAMTVTGNAATTYTGVLTVTTGNGNDTITGGNGADVISSGVGNDTISGGAGADKITSGAGSDTLTGGAGVDIFVFGKTDSGVDTVTDFTVNSTNSSDDRIAVDIKLDDTTNATTTAATVDANAANVHEAASGGQLIADDSVFVLTGNAFVDVSGNAAADLTAIQGAAGGLTMAASDEGLAIFKADTDGDGTADEVQLWYLATDATADTDLDTVTQLGVLSINVSSDLAGDFLVADFDI